MAERKFSAAETVDFVVQCASSHLSTKGARVGFLSYVEYDFGYIRFDKVMRHVEAFAVFYQSVEFGLVRFFQPHINGDCFEGVALRRKASVIGKRT